jgi:hypothetical protein
MRSTKLGGRHASPSLVAGCTRHRDCRVNAHARDMKFSPVSAGLFSLHVRLGHQSFEVVMELLLIILVLVLLFGGGGYWGRRRGHW